MYDLDIRLALKNEFLCQPVKESQTVIFDEIPLNYGSARVDLMVIGKYLHGFEIKSDRDTLARLPEQIRVYNTVFDLVTLVVENSHLDEALPMVPGWWGIKLAELNREGKITLLDVRLPKQNPYQDKLAILKLLSRDEALHLLEEVGEANGLRSKNKELIFQKLIELTDLDWLRSMVRRQLKVRKSY
jgi:hypothetical protein